ncbi:unnamed protein product [Mytilus edulis]|uniref:Uncharacterized protein n=1 Tax=Mytilus edulis TaxID=6550 RepID=A0A8S3QNV1_MYTED|nr:unnamed protein product [Mytilus edulis]
MFDGDDKNYKTDPRLTRSLSIGEFIQAFSIYKKCNVLCLPHRRSELDIYERDIVDMASRYPVSTPIRINILSKHLIDHPDPNFKQYLFDGLSSGFHTGLMTLPSSSIICKNLKSALLNPSCVSELLQSEVPKGYLLGPFDSIPYTNFRINPIGLAEHKNSKKKRLIVDLSAPHENADHPSLNELIDKEEFSLQYVTIDDAIHLIKNLGSKSWLNKTDITDAFKIMPLKQDLWPFHGIQWDNKFFFFQKMEKFRKLAPKADQIPTPCLAPAHLMMV